MSFPSFYTASGSVTQVAEGGLPWRYNPDGTVAVASPPKETHEFTVGGETRRLHAGDYYAIPGGVPHMVLTGESGAVCMDIFSPPRDEYR